MIYVFVTYRCKPGLREAFYEEIQKRGIDAKSRAEEGNSRYEYFFSAENPDTMFLAEEWRDQNVLESHKAQPHFIELQSVKADYIDDSVIFRAEK